MISIRRLNLYSILWHLGFYSEYIGFWGIAKVFFVVLQGLPGKSSTALKYRSMAATKLVPFGIIEKPILENSPYFEFVKEFRGAQMEKQSLDRFVKKALESTDWISGIWSVADLSELANNHPMARDIYSFLTLIRPTTPEQFLYVSLSFFRLGKYQFALELLDDGISRFPKDVSLRSTKPSLGLASGNLSVFLDLPVDSLTDSHLSPKKVDSVAALIARESLTEFATRLPILLSQNPHVTDSLIKAVLKKVRRKIYVFQFTEYVLVTMVRSGVPMEIIEDFKDAMIRKSLLETKNKQKTRALDIALFANFSFALSAESDLNLVWLQVAKLNLTKLELSNPLTELPSWTPWVGAFVQSPMTPLWQTVSRLMPLVRSSWPIVDFVAPHTREPKKPAEKTRIGFLYHSSMPMISGLLPFFPRNEFEVFFIYPKDEAQSKEAVKWKERADKCIEISARDLKSSIDEISKLELDILVSGPSTSSLWFVTLARLARIQAILIEPAWIDGSSNLDYYISWKPAEPIDYVSTYKCSVALMEEPPYWIEPSALPQIESEADRHEVLRKLLNWDEGQRVYLCASTIMKLHPQMDDVIQGILKEDAQARIVFLRGEHLGSDALKARLENRVGSSFNRILFLNTLPPSEAHALLQSVHCVFDSIPLTGMSSSFDGIKLGVPIVTLKTEISYGKWTHAIYEHLGIRGLSTPSKTEFVSMCIKLASDSDFRRNMSSEIQLKTLRLIRSESSAIELVNFVKSAWARYLQGDPPADWVNLEWKSRGQ